AVAVAEVGAWGAEVSPKSSFKILSMVSSSHAWGLRGTSPIASLHILCRQTRYPCGNHRPYRGVTLATSPAPRRPAAEDRSAEAQVAVSPAHSASVERSQVRRCSLPELPNSWGYPIGRFPKRTAPPLAP